MTLPDAIGLFGVVLMLAAYVGVTIGKLSSKAAAFHSANLIGAMCVIYSLFFAWNTASFIMEGAWAAVAAFGLLRALTRRA